MPARAGVLIAAPASGAGKTSAAIGLIAALRKRGVAVGAAKSGPDYLDVAWLAAVSGRPCPNLDSWMASSEACLLKMADNFGSEFLVVEGAMGLFDGAADGSGSCAQLAGLLDLPILLLLDCKGLGQSCAALASGFLSWRPRWSQKPPAFCGIVCNRVGGVRHREILKTALDQVCKQFDAPLLGFLPKDGAPQISSRHLGLCQACENDFDFESAARWFEENCDPDAILARCSPQKNTARTTKFPRNNSAGPTIAIARDAAFGFCYADLPELLRELGAKPVFFSPLEDSAPPPCGGVYLPGGYPELYCERLAANTSMREALRGLAAKNIPIYGECGGFIYMTQSLTDKNGKIWPMLGLLPGKCRLLEKRTALGYRKARPLRFCEAELRGHEFHYCQVEEQGACQPLWRVADSLGRDLGEHGNLQGSVAGSWLHLYPEGSRPFWRAWLKLCREAA